jgi:hypothetical protein
MTPSRIKEVLEKLIEEVWPVFIWGAPGVGKSSLVREVANDKKLPVIDVRAPLLDPTDIRGIPSFSEGKAVWSPPSFLPTEGEGLLFFDELNAAPPLVQASLYQLTLDRAVGEYRLPDGWRIVAAGNRAQDATIVHRMPTALANRFIHLDFEVSSDDWRRWAITNSINPLIVGFLGTRPDLLFDMKDIERAFPTPRSWHMLSDALRRFSKISDSLDVVIGIVGEGAAMEFIGYTAQAISEEAIRAIIESPDTCDLPDDVGDQYALISYLAYQAKDAKVRKAAGALLGRFAPELGVLLARDMIGANRKFAVDPAYLSFAAKHQEFLQ